MKPVDILEWTMGWPWPIIVLLGALLAWGIWRFMSWDEESGKEPAKVKETKLPEGCVCTCT